MNRYEIFMTPTNKPGADEVSVDMTDNLDHAIDLAEGWVVNMGAHRAWVVDKSNGNVPIHFEGDGSVPYIYAQQTKEDNDA